MRGKYKAAFILPMNTNKLLSDSGWEFESNQRLSLKLKESLISFLNLEFLESYLGMERFARDGVEVLFVYDAKGDIESIAVKLYDENALLMVKEFCGGSLGEGLELFLPNE